MEQTTRTSDKIKHGAASQCKKDVPGAGMDKNVSSKPRERIDDWGLNPILVPNLQKNPLEKCQEGWRYNPESLVRIHCSYHIYSHFGIKTEWISKHLDEVVVSFQNLKSQYLRVAVQPLFQHFVRFYHAGQSSVPKNLYFCISLSDLASDVDF